MKQKWLAFFSYGTLTLAYLCLAIWIYWSVAPYPTINYLSEEFPVSDSVVQQGDDITYNVRYCKTTDQMPTIKKQFVDGIIFNAEEFEAFIEKGCGDIDIPLHIPDTLPPGNYKLRVTITYKVNPIRNIEKTHETNWFQVLERK
jgi:hypothetical protein